MSKRDELPLRQVEGRVGRKESGRILLYAVEKRVFCLPREEKPHPRPIVGT